MLRFFEASETHTHRRFLTASATWVLREFMSRGLFDLSANVKVSLKETVLKWTGLDGYCTVCTRTRPAVICASKLLGRGAQ